MGKSRKPISIKKLEGNRGKKKLPSEPEPDYSGKLPPPPAYLKGVGLREWKRAGALMSGQGVLTAADWQEFACYCHAVQRRDAIARALGDYVKPKGVAEIVSEKLEEWHRLDRALDSRREATSKGDDRARSYARHTLQSCAG
jgi:phage terminase small subunit